MTLGCSNWTICSPQNLFYTNKFPLFNRPHAAFPFSCIQRKGHLTVDPKSEWEKVCMTLGHSNWTIWSQLNLILENKFPLFNRPHAAFPYSCMQRKGTLKWTPKANEFFINFQPSLTGRSQAAGKKYAGQEQQSLTWKRKDRRARDGARPFHSTHPEKIVA